ncbi:P-loop NTPase fold protein [Salinigranum sp.]|uniref:KAP family P-loop NTPase fold protein n=1 Tax=Salinigranum sp. TaxID=1966351 RepID=UPI00356B2E4B
MTDQPEWEGEPGARTPVGAAFGDRPTAHDALGFEPYVGALATFLRQRETTPPLAVSVEGTWGAGKSSFMSQLEHELRSEGHLTVRFNPWRHEGEDALWAAFMLAVLDGLSRKLTPQDRRRARLALVLDRFDRRRGRAAVARAMGTTLLAVLAVVVTAVLAAVAGPTLLGSADSTAVVATFGFGGGVTSFVGVWLWTRRNVVERTERELEAYVRDPNYEGHVSFLERFHEDLRRVLDAYVGDHRVFVFIDDLDRCAVPRAAELMQSINLMLSDDPRLVFLLGMDREKVAAGLAAKHEDLLDHLNVESRQSFGLDYGYAFIEKFVQVPFLIPRPSPDDVDRFVMELMAFQREYGDSFGPDEFVAMRTAEYPQVSPQNPPEPAEPYTLWARDWSDETLRTALGWAAPALGYNPRQIKKFISLYRLRALLAQEVGVFEQTDLTLDQLGKFVTISLRWPRLLPELNRDHDLFARLTAVALRDRFHEALSEAAPPVTPAVAAPDPTDATADRPDDAPPDGDASESRTVGVDELPVVLRSERDWELFADLLLAGLYDGSLSATEFGSDLLVTYPELTTDRFDEFFEDRSVDEVLWETDADLDASLAHVDVESLLQISPRADVPTETLEETPYAQSAKYRPPHTQSDSEFFGQGDSGTGGWFPED